MRIECPNYLMKEKTKKSKDEGLVATSSDTKNDSSNEVFSTTRVSTNLVVSSSLTNSSAFSVFTH